jgi:hypothetical protein
MAKGLLPEAQQPCLTMRTIGVAHTATRTAIQSSSEAERAEGVAPCVEYVDWARQREQRVNVGVLDLTSSICVGRREAGYRNREKQLALHRKKARRAVSHRRTPTGEPCSVRGGNGRFDYNRNRAFERRARSAPTGAAHSSAHSCSSAMGSIPAGRGVCGRGRAAGTNVGASASSEVPDPEHMTRAGACPAAGGRQRARSAPKHNAPRRGGCFAKGVCASAQAPVRSWTAAEGWRPTGGSHTL